MIIAHRLSTIALADEIVVLDDGRIAARGTHDELLATSAVYREIYEHGLLERAVRRRAWRRRAMRVWQPGVATSPVRARRAQVDDWSLAAHAPAARGARPARRAPYKAPHRARARLRCSLATRDRARAAVPGEARDRRRDQRAATSTALGWIVGAFVVAGLAELGA